MDPLQEPLSHLVPAIVVDVESSALRHKHQCIDVHDRTEDARQIREEGRIQSQEGKDQNTSQNSSERVGCQTDLNKVIGQLVVALCKRLILRHYTHKLDDHTENRDGQHEAAVVEMLLIRKPEQHTTFKVISRIVLHAICRLRSGSTGHDALGLIIDIPTLFDFIPILLCRIARMSLFTDGQ